MGVKILEDTSTPLIAFTGDTVHLDCMYVLQVTIYCTYVSPNTGVYTLKTQILPVIIHHQQKLFQPNSIKVFSSEERLWLFLVGANCKNEKCKHKPTCFK